MDSKIIGISIAAVVSLIVLAGVLMPVLNDAEHAGAESYSNGTTYMSKATGTVDMIITNNHSIISNGNEIAGYDYVAFMSDTCWIAINVASVNVFWNDGTAGFSPIGGANVTIDADAKTITLSDITLVSSSTLTETTLTVDYNSDCYYRSVDGDYAQVAYSSIGDVRVLADSQIAGVGYAGSNIVWWNGTEVSYDGTVKSNPGVITLTDSTPAEFKTVTISYTPEGGTAINPIKVIVPATIWTEGAIDDSSLMILGAIPVLIIVSILMGIVVLILSRRQ